MKQHTDPETTQPVDAANNSAGPSGPFGLVGVDEIFAPLPPVESTVAGLMRKGSVTLLVGPSGGRKTYVVLSFMLATVFGAEWLGALPTLAGVAVMLDFEIGGYELRRRLQLMYRAYSDTPPPAGSLWISPMSTLYMTSPGFFDAVLELATRASLIVIDSLLAACPGVDENHSSIREYIDGLRRVADQTGCSIVVVHHTGKNSSDLRGSSAIRDAADEVLLLAPLKNGRTRISRTKGRHGPAGEGITFETLHLPDEQIFLIAVDDLGSEEFDKSSEGEPIRNEDRQVLEFVRRNPRCGKREVREGAGLSHDAADAALRRLLTADKIRNIGTASKHEYVVVDSEGGEGQGSNSPPAAPGTPPGVPGVPVPLGARHGTPGNPDRAERAGTPARARSAGGEFPPSFPGDPPWRAE
jgi:hypothetical protein